MSALPAFTQAWQAGRALDIDAAISLAPDNLT